MSRHAPGHIGSICTVDVAAIHKPAAHHFGLGFGGVGELLACDINPVSSNRQPEPP